MKTLTIAIVLFFAQERAIASSHFDICDNRVDTSRGELAGGPFFGMGLAMSFYYYAEKLCEAKPYPMSKVFLEHITRHGCGEETDIYKQIQTSIERVEASTITEFATEGQHTDYSESEIVASIYESLSRGFATESIADTCKILSIMHDGMVKHGYGNK